MKVILSVLIILSLFSSCGHVKSRHKKLSGEELLILGKAARINKKSAKAKAYIELACRKKSLEACLMYTDYIGSYGDKDKIEAIMKKACIKGFKRACPSLSLKDTTKKYNSLEKKGYEFRDTPKTKLVRDLIILMFGGGLPNQMHLPIN